MRSRCWRGSRSSTSSGARRCRRRRTAHGADHAAQLCVFGAPGLLFDQEYGLLAYAPVYMLAVTGLFALWRAGGERRRLALEMPWCSARCSARLARSGIWWGGSSAPARPLASGLLLLVLPIAAAFGAAPAGSARRAAQHLLLWIGVGIAITLTFAQEGLLIANGARRHVEPARVVVAALGAVDAGAELHLSRRRPPRCCTRRPGCWSRQSRPPCCRDARVSPGDRGAGGIAACSAPRWRPRPSSFRCFLTSRRCRASNLEARARLAALDSFDTRALPAAMISIRCARPALPRSLPRSRSSCSPGLRPDPQPVRVLHNGRFSLPAGDYRVDADFGPSGPAAADALSLQIGRVGPPLLAWTVPAAAPALRETFHLPVDASFIGFRGSRALEQALQSLTITPLAVMNAGERVHSPTVLGAAQYRPDDGAAARRQSVSGADRILGARPTPHVSVSSAPGQRPVVLRIRSGAMTTR